MSGQRHQLVAVLVVFSTCCILSGWFLLRQDYPPTSRTIMGTPGPGEASHVAPAPRTSVVLSQKPYPLDGKKLFIAGMAGSGVAELRAKLQQYTSRPIMAVDSTLMEPLLRPNVLPSVSFEPYLQEDIIVGDLPSFFFTKLIRTGVLQERGYQVVLVTRCVSSWAEDLAPKIPTYASGYQDESKFALFALSPLKNYRVPRPLYLKKRFREAYDLWTHLLEKHQYPYTTISLDGHGTEALQELGAKWGIDLSPLAHTFSSGPCPSGTPLQRLHIPKALDPTQEDYQLKLHCAGMSKTGTTSLHSGASGLGLVSDHYTPKVLSLNDGLYDLGRSDEEFLLRGISPETELISDLPHAYYALEYAQLFPQLGTIVLERGADDWMVSYSCYVQTQWKGQKPSATAILRNAAVYSTLYNPLVYHLRYVDINDHVLLVIDHSRMLRVSITEDSVDAWDRLVPFMEDYLHRGLASMKRPPAANINHARKENSTICLWDVPQ